MLASWFWGCDCWFCSTVDDFPGLIYCWTSKINLFCCLIYALLWLNWYLASSDLKCFSYLAIVLLYHQLLLYKCSRVWVAVNSIPLVFFYEHWTVDLHFYLFSTKNWDSVCFSDSREIRKSSDVCIRLSSSRFKRGDNRHLQFLCGLV